MHYKGLHFIAADVPRGTPDVAPCHTIPPIPMVFTCLARSTRCNTSHLATAYCSISVSIGDWADKASVSACVRVSARVCVSVSVASKRQYWHW